MINSHRGLTISSDEAHLCCQLDVEVIKIQVRLYKHPSTVEVYKQTV
jgi:hypothetical protein